MSYFRTLAVILVSEFIFVMINAPSVLRNIGQKEFKPSEDLSSHENFFLKYCCKKMYHCNILISHLVYIMQALVIPDHVLTEINRLVFRFLWRKKKKSQKRLRKSEEMNCRTHV